MLCQKVTPTDPLALGNIPTCLETNRMLESSLLKPSCLESSELKGSLKQIILEGYILKDDIEKEYRSYRGEKTFEVHARNLTRGWSLKVAKWAGNAEDVLQEIDVVAQEQFKVYRGPTLPRGRGDEKWGTIDNWLNDKLHFLERFYDNLGIR